MSESLRRGACPSLSAPMATGDGLLVRLNPRGGELLPRQLAGVAEAALRHGNGLLEITARGSLQIRGLIAGTVEPFTDVVAGLAIVSDAGLEVRSGALAGRDVSEIANPLPLAAAIRAGASARGLSGRLAPKVSVVLDGGGALGLGALAADIRLKAVVGGDAARWLLAVAGGKSGARILLERADAEEAVERCLDCLAVLAANGPASRARELPLQAFAQADDALPREGLLASASPEPTMPVGEFSLRDGSVARGFSLPFGQIGGRELIAFAERLDPEWELRLAPGRGLLVLGLTRSESGNLTELARDHGLVTKADDPRLRIAACAGAPACGSGHLPTRKIAATVVSQAPGLLRDGAMLHISGCAKKCARPADPSLELVGSRSGWVIEGREVRGDGKAARSLARIAAQFGPGKRHSA